MDRPSAIKPNSWIYIYYVVDDKIIFDRSVSRTGLGPVRAKQKVAELEKTYGEAFYTIGFSVQGAYS